MLVQTLTSGILTRLSALFCVDNEKLTDEITGALSEFIAKTARLSISILPGNSVSAEDTKKTLASFMLRDVHVPTGKNLALFSCLARLWFEIRIYSHKSYR